jgi:hypothetical protein
MSHQHSNVWRPRRFRTFVTNQYYANRDEYDSVGQTQPHTFEAYVAANLSLLKQQFKVEFRKQRQLANSTPPASARSLI